MSSCEYGQLERSSLAFPEAVRSAFEALQRYGFREVAAEATVVRYSTERVFVNIYHGRSSYELGAEIGLISSENGSESGYSLSAIIRLGSQEEAQRFRYFTATTADEVKNGIRQLAEKLFMYAERPLRGDEQFFDALKRQRQECSAVLAADVAYRQVSPKAEEAFRRKEYREATELYESILGKLSAAELKKLDYARKHH